MVARMALSTLAMGCFLSPLVSALSLTSSARVVGHASLPSLRCMGPSCSARVFSVQDLTVRRQELASLAVNRWRDAVAALPALPALPVLPALRSLPLSRVALLATSLVTVVLLICKWRARIEEKKAPAAEEKSEWGSLWDFGATLATVAGDVVAQSASAALSAVPEVPTSTAPKPEDTDPDRLLLVSKWRASVEDEPSEAKDDVKTSMKGVIKPTDLKSTVAKPTVGTPLPKSKSSATKPERGLIEKKQARKSPAAEFDAMFGKK